MKYHENHQKRALSVIIAVSSKNRLFVRGLSPTSKSMALAHLDPVAAFGRKTRGGCGSWCVCVWVCARSADRSSGLGHAAPLPASTCLGHAVPLLASDASDMRPPFGIHLPRPCCPSSGLGHAAPLPASTCLGHAAPLLVSDMRRRFRHLPASAMWRLAGHGAPGRVFLSWRVIMAGDPDIICRHANTWNAVATCHYALTCHHDRTCLAVMTRPRAMTRHRARTRLAAMTCHHAKPCHHSRACLAATTCHHVKVFRHARTCLAIMT